MTIEELKQDLLGKTYPNEVQIFVDQLVTDVPKFLRVSFIELEKWTKDIEKCPAYVRLIRFRAAVQPATTVSEDQA